MAASGREASADLFVGQGLPSLPPPAPAACTVFGNTAVYDGDGVFPFGGPGLGLVEPNPPGFALPDPGDNVDALVFRVFASIPVYFSLDASFPDPLEPFPVDAAVEEAGDGRMAQVGEDLALLLEPP